MVPVSLDGCSGEPPPPLLEQAEIDIATTKQIARNQSEAYLDCMVRDMMDSPFGKEICHFDGRKKSIIVHYLKQDFRLRSKLTVRK
jgi:hypothetical protein